MIAPLINLWVVTFAQMCRNILILFLFLYSAQLNAQLFDIKIFSKYNSSALTIYAQKGSYQVFANNNFTTSITSGQPISFKATGGAIDIYKSGVKIFSSDSILIQSRNTESAFKIKLNDRRVRSRQYEGNVTLINHNNSLKIINTIDMNRYLGGVIETEGGAHRPDEYYKVQAIISRTYALVHRKRHNNEGFNLCDGVHCQSYKSMVIHSPEVKEAVRQTADVVMVDTNGQMINGFFSANCGGQTSETDWVWNQKLSYLPSVKDTFCTKTWQANWTKKVEQTKWRDFLTEEYKFPANNPHYKKYLYHFDQPKRAVFYGPSELGIPLHELRTHFHLKSTFFSVRPEGRNVVLSGHGFGHGIGMCQEGAMEMAKSSFDYKKIIRFYFRPIRLIDYQWLIYMNWPKE